MIDDDIDFMLLGCDGVFDNLSNKEIFEGIMATFESDTPVTVYYNNKPTFSERYKSDDINIQMGLITDSLIRSCFKSLSNDNISIILICFENFKRLFESSDLKKNALRLKEKPNERIDYYAAFKEPSKSRLSVVKDKDKMFKRSYSSQSQQSIKSG